MTDVKTALPTGAISRTYIGPDGKKVGKAKTLGRPLGIVRLSPDDEVLEGLHLAEGLETALTGMSNFGLRPMWSTGSASAIAAFPVLDGIECLTLLAENDDASRRAVETFAARWHAAGREVIINEPLGGKDLNDALRRVRP
jgi:putative DNA primase/helicase